MNDLQFDPVRLSVRRDLLIVAVVAIATFWIASAFELSEHLTALTKPFEAYQFDELPTTLVVMLVALAWFSWRRARQAIEQVNLRLTAQQQLAEALSENRRLSQRYLKVQEEERRLLARELHDELGQSLNAIKVDAVNIRDAAGNSREVTRSAQAIIDVSSKVYDVVRTLLRQLRPVALDELGLSSAVQYSVEEWKRRHRGVECVLSIDDNLDGFSEEVNISVYRFVQECLTNIARHANASRVTINLHRRVTSDGSTELDITVVDDGRGVGAGGPASGLGLVGLRERIEALGGEFDIETPGEGGFNKTRSVHSGLKETGFSGAGTRVLAKIPIEPGSWSQSR
jgi:glucose-6-phosphate-specific signal transduction histidine kinase